MLTKKMMKCEFLCPEDFSVAENVPVVKKSQHPRLLHVTESIPHVIYMLFFVCY